jgi:hypothetical protein
VACSPRSIAGCWRTWTTNRFPEWSECPCQKPCGRRGAGTARPLVSPWVAPSQSSSRVNFTGGLIGRAVCGVQGSARGPGPRQVGGTRRSRTAAERKGAISPTRRATPQSENDPPRINSWHEGRAQRALPLRLGSQVQAVPWALDIAASQPDHCQRSLHASGNAGSRAGECALDCRSVSSRSEPLAWCRRPRRIGISFATVGGQTESAPP